ncbi:ferrous iron transport protein B [Mesoterricola sediminis]|uniref:Ferrous iron transport protein B n=1 Tax=Mesoterricola sediminis TaxID=2927980 RepID=A0AA48GSY5_9BACT|nr:ferrous iron transport protein B [Mesoterricola sediminis]BDU77109.1 ferrous iron transport protein B [Mesoterricola sediminis]
MATVALAGNPNCGKTSLFNALTGAHQHVGNWPGVTVERRSGTFRQDGLAVEVVDLPGTYSLAARSEDERVATDFLASQEADVIVNVLDASNLERNLYLTTQLLELRKPVVFALNMMDDAVRDGWTLDVPTLSALLGGPVVVTVGNRGEGIEALKAAILAQVRGDDPSLDPAQWPPRVTYGDDVEGEIRRLAEEVRRDEVLTAHLPGRWWALRLLEGAPDALEEAGRSHAAQAIQAQLARSRAFLEAHLGAGVDTLLAERRYGFAHGLVREVGRREGHPARHLTDRLDAVLTGRFLGFPIFLIVMVAIYTLTFVVGKYPQDWVSAGMGWLHDTAAAHLPPGELTSLFVDGVIPGVGSVLVFLPSIMILMGCVSFLEDTGYMARAAFIMDRLMHLMGLHGKSFIPLIMGMGCNTPAIQATRTLEARSDRLITILVTPFMSCSARLPVYILLAGAFFRPLQGALAVVGMHLLGFAVAIVAGKVLRLTLFRRENAPFVMELPPYRLPVLKTTLLHMWEKATVFLRKAGTLIFAGATLIWFLSNYPGLADRDLAARHRAAEAAVRAQGLPEAEEKAKLEDLDLAHKGTIMNSSLAARFGKVLEPAFRPLFDPDHRRAEAWKDGVALTAGFLAKEIVVGTMAVVHQARAEGEDGAALSPLQQSLRDRSGLTPLTALAFMVFVLIYTPCLGTVGMIYKETRSLGWTLFSVGYGLGLGWVLAWITVAGGRLLGFA